ncbi:MAG: hypothetical protein QM767_22745 [Anaeromyxobacter sp.]
MIWLHAHEAVELTSASVAGAPVQVVRAPGDLLGLVPAAPLAAGTVDVKLEFTAAVSRSGKYHRPLGVLTHQDDAGA